MCPQIQWPAPRIELLASKCLTVVEAVTKTNDCLYLKRQALKYFNSQGAIAKIHIAAVGMELP